MQGARFIAVIAVICAAATPRPLLGDDSAKFDRAERCAALTARALKLLDEGEAAPSKEEKVAAYSTGRELALEAVALDPSNADAHFVVFATEGRMELLKGAVPNPISLYKVQGRLDRVLDLDPGHPGGLAAKGGLYRQLPWALGGNLEKAEVYLKRAIEQDPGAIGARIELAATYSQMGHPERCMPLLDEAIALAEEQGKPHRKAEAEALREKLAQPRK